ncbi:hypothetical protein ACLOJK_017983 [Asimina triloba]
MLLSGVQDLLRFLDCQERCLRDSFLKPKVQLVVGVPINMSPVRQKRLEDYTRGVLGVCTSTLMSVGGIKLYQTGERIETLVSIFVSYVLLGPEALELDYLLKEPKAVLSFGSPYDIGCAGGAGCREDSLVIASDKNISPLIFDSSWTTDYV